MSDTRRSVLKKGIAAATISGLGLASATGSASAETYGTVVRIEPQSTSSGLQSYEVGFPANNTNEEDDSLEDTDYLAFEGDQAVVGGTVENGVDDFDKVSTEANEEDVVVNRAEDVVVYVNGSAIYP